MKSESLAGRKTTSGSWESLRKRTAPPLHRWEELERLQVEKELKEKEIAEEIPLAFLFDFLFDFFSGVWIV